MYVFRDLFFIVTFKPNGSPILIYCGKEGKIIAFLAIVYFDRANGYLG